MGGVITSPSGRVRVAYTVEFSFGIYFDAINLPGDHRSLANTRRDDILASLNKRMTILEAFATGSIPRFTALESQADLDVIAVLHYDKHVRGKGPSEVLQAVRDTLAEFRTNVRRNGQAVTLYYKTWPNVDIVPTVRILDSDGNVVGLEIPDARRGEWIRTNPKRHSADIEARSSSVGPLFRKLIKMLKHWNARNGGLLQSYHIEVIALKTLTTTPSDAAWGAYQLFEGASQQVATWLWHGDGFADDYLTQADRDAVRERLRDAASTALRAWARTYPPDDDHETAIKLWRHLLGYEFPRYG